MKVISTQEAPKPIGPYSQSIRAGGFLFCSGQIPLDPASGTLVEGTVAVQTERVMDNIAAILKAADISFDDVVKTTIYLIDLGDFAEVNAVYARYLGKTQPARSTVGIAELPLGARVEIEVTARL
ncbi:MAG TPA: RidA family protein [Candidatus Baltobacteraceae bacterium]|jgi:2-iminobutanoate/2-iminopropanoate deaminase|nr:RidA family protein [Candidatus Baltobacteraceae bacterium]